MKWKNDEMIIWNDDNEWRENDSNKWIIMINEIIMKNNNEKWKWIIMKKMKYE